MTTTTLSPFARYAGQRNGDEVMVSSADRADIPCEIWKSPPSVLGGRVGYPVPFLTDRLCTPLWPISQPAQFHSFDSMRDSWQCFIFATDSADWASTLKQVVSGMVLKVGEMYYTIQQANRYQRNDITLLHDFLHLIVQEMRAAP